MNLRHAANALRALAIDAVEHAQSGHPGMPLGMADVVTVLFSKFLKFNPKDPLWPDRDRFVLSAGHGSMLLYGLLYLTGYEGMTLDDLKAFRQLGSKTAGHPEYEPHLGIETTTGPLGQGFANAVGMALAERNLRARFGTGVCHHKIYTIVGDGCLMEGISQEALSFAGHQRLDNLIVLFDDNGITIDGKTELSTSEDHIARFQANGWQTMSIDGHNFDEIEKALSVAQNGTRPVLIACKTTIGYGSPAKAGSEKSHGSPLGPDEVQATKQALNWPYGSFEIPENTLALWRGYGTRSDTDYALWKQAVQTMDTGAKDAYHQHLRVTIPGSLRETIKMFCDTIAQEKPKLATRKSSERVIDLLEKELPTLLGGSADLTGSNNTKGREMKPLTKDNPQGTYIYYGIREHAMAAIMNGLALHGGFIPYGGTFLVFSDYCRPAIRLSALMAQRVIYVMTHDSIGLGEDGPTHQPVEHLWSLRLIPNLYVFRPADTIETAECWECALTIVHGPSVLALSRQGLPTVRQASDTNLCAKGGYVLKDTQGATFTLLATGSEVALALEVAAHYAQQGVPVRVVSMPCVDLFLQQDKAYQQQVLGTVVRISLEAGRTEPWSALVGDSGLSLGVDTFGASAPGGDVYAHFGLTLTHICKRIDQHMETQA